jgi:hypothetical protein
VVEIKVNPATAARDYTIQVVATLAADSQRPIRRSDDFYHSSPNPPNEE